MLLGNKLIIILLLVFSSIGFASSVNERLDAIEEELTELKIKSLKKSI